MSQADEFRDYAEEALRWARRADNDRDRLALLELARTWTLAAERSSSPMPPPAGRQTTEALPPPGRP